MSGIPSKDRKRNERIKQKTEVADLNFFSMVQYFKLFDYNKYLLSNTESLATLLRVHYGLNNTRKLQFFIIIRQAPHCNSRVHDGLLGSWPLFDPTPVQGSFTDNIQKLTLSQTQYWKGCAPNLNFRSCGEGKTENANGLPRHQGRWAAPTRINRNKLCSSSLFTKSQSRLFTRRDISESKQTLMILKRIRF